MEIRPAGAGDLAEIVKVARGCVEAPQWSEAVWEGLLKVAAAGLRCVMVLEIASGLVGFVVIGGMGMVAEIENIGVDPAHRRLGLGAALCRAAMRWAAERECVAMELEVRASNVAAGKMYARLGFVEQGVRRGYYREPAEDAVLMAAALYPVEL